MRHAKSDWHAGAASDHNRPLNVRGTRAASTMGRVLTTMGEAPDLIFTSSAARARETALLAADAGGWVAETAVFDELYGANVRGALDIAARAPEGVSRLMLVGHQPTWSNLVRHLTGADAQIKTTAVAAIDIPIDGWAAITTASGSLAFLLQPRLFPNQET